MESSKLTENKATFIVLVLLNTHLINGAVVYSTSGESYHGDTLTLTFIITPPFTGSAVISKDGTSRSTCLPSVCSPASDNNVTFSPSITGITVEFYPVSSNHAGNWKCDNSNGDSSNYTFSPEKRRLTIKSSGDDDLNSDSYGIKCKIPGFNKPSCWRKQGRLMSNCSKTFGCSEITSQSYSFSQDDSSINVDFIQLESSEDEMQWTCEHTGDTPENFVVEIDFRIAVIGIQCACLVVVCLLCLICMFIHIRKQFKKGLTKDLDDNPPYTSHKTCGMLFGDRLSVCGVSFKVIQLLFVAAFYQVVVFMTTMIVLVVLHNRFWDYDVDAILATVACVFTALCHVLCFLVYVFIVIYYRKTSGVCADNDDKKLSPWCFTGLFLIVIFPVAWFLLIVIVIVNFCRKLCGDEKRTDK
ncbi:uncharacterized protein LOC127707328 [Mytilus californianus]|uniref:uncharacterized protein LOC127707328 n=1 Tax=Mytilus californianus TaxID=6549 RepID=UPI0022476C15|nr:uncharacterized protein LOC127707328 [Mytilus californianus]